MPDRKPGVIVTDGHNRAGLAVVRSLGRAGYRVGVCALRSPSLAGVSRYAADAIAVPDALADPSGFTAAVLGYARAQDASVLVPMADPSIIALLGRAPSRLTVPFPSIERWSMVADKTAVGLAAAASGITVPPGVILPSADIGDELLRALRYPIVLKPHRSVVGKDGGRVRVSVLHAATPEDVPRLLEALPESAFPVMAQERIVGPGTGIFVLVWDGKLIAAFAHQRLREKPPSGGVSVYSESVPLDRDLLDRSLDLLRRFHWQGVAMLEYKRRASDGTPFLMEINGRFWGSLQLAIDAGVDFPRLLVDAALGRAPAPVTSYRVGARSRWWWGDVDHLLLRLRRNPRQLDLPVGAPTRLQALGQFIGTSFGARSDVFRWSDPKPFVRETLDWVQGRSS